MISRYTEPIGEYLLVLEDYPTTYLLKVGLASKVTAEDDVRTGAWILLEHRGNRKSLLASGRKWVRQAKQKAAAKQPKQEPYDHRTWGVDTAVALGRLALAFGQVRRATLHEDGVTPETDTTHTVMLGLIAFHLRPAHLDPGKVLLYALIHDLVEAKVDDTNSFDISEEARAAKDKREAQGFRELEAEFIGSAPWLVYALQQYELQRVWEARYIRYLDKALPKITHAFNGCAGIKAMGKTKADMVRAHRKQLASLNEEYPELAGELGPLLESLMQLSEDAW